MTGKENTRPSGATLRRAVESGTACKTTRASTTNDTTIGGLQQ